jgi:hypothetical protein
LAIESKPAARLASLKFLEPPFWQKQEMNTQKLNANLFKLPTGASLPFFILVPAPQASSVPRCWLFPFLGQQQYPPPSPGPS